jgi:hypothetical protein
MIEILEFAALCSQENRQNGDILVSDTTKML